MASTTSEELGFEDSSSPINDSKTYGSVSAPSYDPGYKFEESTYADPKEKERLMQEWRDELMSLEDTIKTLSVTLNSKIQRAEQLKQNLGLSPHNPLKDLQLSLQSGIKSIKDSNTYQKTSAAAKTVQVKTSSALTTIGSSVSKKMGDIRNSQTFKSLEEKVETTYTNVKAKVRGSKSDNNLDSPTAEEEEPLSAENPSTDQHEQIPL